MVTLNLPRQKKPNPKTIPFKEYVAHANAGGTLADLARKHGVFEAQLREYTAKVYPELHSQMKLNQLHKFKTTQAKIIKASKPVVIKVSKEPVHNGLKLANNYKNCIKLYKGCIICSSCSLVIAHTNDSEIQDNLIYCPTCNDMTVIEDVQLNTYRKLILLKKNHMSAQELMEKEETFNG